jgi:hypothetical protein
MKTKSIADAPPRGLPAEAYHRRRDNRNALPVTNDGAAKRRSIEENRKSAQLFAKTRNPCYTSAHSPDRTHAVTHDLRRKREGLQRLRHSAQRQRQEWIFSYFFRRNPLKSPDSDE